MASLSSAVIRFAAHRPLMMKRCIGLVNTAGHPDIEDEKSKSQSTHHSQKYENTLFSLPSCCTSVRESVPGQDSTAGLDTTALDRTECMHRPTSFSRGMHALRANPPKHLSQRRIGAAHSCNLYLFVVDV